MKDFEKQGHSHKSIKAVGITNQRETTVVWDHETGEPLYNAIVWTDTRTQALVRKLKSRLGSDKLQDLCGLPLSTYPSVGKVLWCMENVPKVAEGKHSLGLIWASTDNSKHMRKGSSLLAQLMPGWSINSMEARRRTSL